MTLLPIYQRLRNATSIDEGRANEIVRVARPHTAAALGLDASDPNVLNVTARRVEPSAAKGGSLIPAWPFRADDGSVTIEFVDDWGVLLAGWRAAVGESTDPTFDLDAFIRSGERLWVGIANAVLQMYVTDPPAGTYTMVRHHALMLGAATLWLGPERARVWHQAHALAARGFLRRLGNRPLWTAIESAERGLARLLEDRRGRATAGAVLT